jgi:hypothetical protein
LTRHIGSSGLPGHNSDTPETKLMIAPTTKKPPSTVTPIGRRIADAARTSAAPAWQPPSVNRW